MKKYIPSQIEPKWQKKWKEDKIYSTPKEAKNKKYVLDMFPYPSSATMHVGHLEGYVGTDIISRFERMKGSSVLHPMGWDAFGLPAENYAIKTGIHPDKSTHKNIETFKRQLNMTGLSYDWNREIDTSSPQFYKWTQWLFILMLKQGLAYKKEADVNWCPSCQTVLANEQVVEGKCDRCATEVIQKKLDQWFLKITDYADRLISGLDKIDWLEEVKIQQKNWIGKKAGINIEYKIEGSKDKIVCFTTRPDTNFGATFIVVGPEYQDVLKLTKKEYLEAVKKYIKSVSNKSAERLAEGRKKTGVFTGSYAINNLNGKKLPIWVSDFVLGNVGTGAVIGVPGHDLRDFEFAKQFDLEVIRVVVGKDGDTFAITRVEQVQEAEGMMINSQFLDGMDIHKATVRIMDYFEEKGWGKRVTSYHLRDWLISRQRYWGAPIPMIYCQKCSWQPVAEKDLPVELPTDVDFKPTGESPIARSKSFQENVICPNCKAKAKREVDTMDTYVDSSWYFIRFADPANSQEFASQKAIRDWLPVDSYVGGGHVVQHLLFARFFWKVLFDAGLIDKSLGDEPFLKLRAPGWILGPDSRKMSKRWNNVVTPDDVIPNYGADAMRLYEMFLGPFEVMKPWSLTGVAGVYRFLQRVWGLQEKVTQSVIPSVAKDLKMMHKTIKKVTEDIEGNKFNTAVSSLMEWLNHLSRKDKISSDEYKTLLLLLAPFAPHMTEELWEIIGEKYSIHKQSLAADATKHSWPQFDNKYLEDEEVTVAIQINGKVRDTLVIQKDIISSGKDVEKMALTSTKVQKFLQGQSVKKVVYIPGKIMSFVVSS